MSQTDESETELVPVFLQAYEEDSDLDVDYEGYAPTVENHDELVNEGKTYHEVRALTEDSALEHGLIIIRPGHRYWLDEMEDIESGDVWRVDEIREAKASD